MPPVQERRDLLVQGVQGGAEVFAGGVLTLVELVEDGLEVDFVQNSFFPPTKIVNQYIAKIMDQYKNKKIKWH